MKRIFRKALRNYLFWALDYSADEISVKDLKTVVIYQPEAVGDAMAIYPVLRALETTNVEHIILVLSPRNSAVFEHYTHPTIKITKRIIPHRFELTHKDIKAEARSINHEYGKPDLCIEATRRNKADSTIFIGYLKARSNIGINGSSMKCYVHTKGMAMTMHKNKDPLPLVWKQLMQDAGFQVQSGTYEFPVGVKDDEHIQQLKVSFGRYILLNLDGSHANRQLSVPIGIQIAKQLHEACSYNILVTFSPSGEAKAKLLSEALPYVHLLPTPPSLANTATWVKYASLVVSPDTSILHMSSAYDIPSIGIYTNKSLVGHWRQLSTHSQKVIAQETVDQFEMKDLQAAIQQLMPAIVE